MSEIREAPITFHRRQLLKTAAASGVAAMAGGSVAYAQSAEKDALQNNGVAPELRIRNDTLTPEAKKTLLSLQCEYIPVAVKFLAVKPENFGLKYEKLSDVMSLCQFAAHAQKTGKAFYIDKDNENCMGKMVLGMDEEPPIGASGQAGFDFGCYRSQAPNSRVYYEMRKLFRNTVNYVIFSPLDQCEFNPDLIYFVVKPEVGDILLRATSYISGDLWISKSTNVISCAWTFVDSWLHGYCNHLTTGQHHGMMRRKVYPAGLQIIVVPYQKIDEVVLALRQMDWKLISFRPDDADQDELRRRMRNWNNLAKQIDASASFALPENPTSKK